MSDDLYPTPSRLDLLQAVDDGAVHQIRDTGGAGARFASRTKAQRDYGPGASPRYRTVTAAIEDMVRARWVLLGDVDPNHHRRNARRYDLDETGRTVLAAGRQDRRAS